MFFKNIMDFAKNCNKNLKFKRTRTKLSIYCVIRPASECEKKPICKKS